jgi:hypothetical protein
LNIKPDNPAFIRVSGFCALILAEKGFVVAHKGGVPGE